MMMIMKKMMMKMKKEEEKEEEKRKKNKRKEEKNIVLLLEKIFTKQGTIVIYVDSFVGLTNRGRGIGVISPGILLNSLHTEDNLTRQRKMWPQSQWSLC